MIICDYCGDPITNADVTYTATLPGTRPGVTPNETGAIQLQLHAECCDVMNQQVKNIKGKRPIK